MIVHDKSSFVDQQTFKLQEIAEQIPIGELPRHIVMTADRYFVAFQLMKRLIGRSLTNKVVPGTRVTITGIYTTTQTKPNVCVLLITCNTLILCRK